MILELQGSEAVVRAEGSRIEDALRGKKLERLESEAGEAESARARDLASAHGFPLHLRGAVRPGRLGGALDKVLRLLDAAGLHSRFRAHALSGVFDVWVEGYGKPSEGELLEAVGRSRMVCEERGPGGYQDGSLKIFKGPPSLRSKIDSWGGDAGARRLMDKIQKLVDPSGILAGSRAP